jgi:hypothetical protein
MKRRIPRTPAQTIVGVERPARGRKPAGKVVPFTTMPIPDGPTRRITVPDLTPREQAESLARHQLKRPLAEYFPEGVPDNLTCNDVMKLIHTEAYAEAWAKVDARIKAANAEPATAPESSSSSDEPRTAPGPVLRLVPQPATAPRRLSKAERLRQAAKEVIRARRVARQMALAAGSEPAEPVLQQPEPWRLSTLVTPAPRPGGKTIMAEIKPVAPGGRTINMGSAEPTLAGPTVADASWPSPPDPPRLGLGADQAPPKQRPGDDEAPTRHRLDGDGSAPRRRPGGDQAGVRCDVGNGESATWLHLGEAAQRLGTSVDAVRAKVRRGHLEHRKGNDGRIVVRVGDQARPGADQAPAEQPRPDADQSAEIRVEAEPWRLMAERRTTELTDARADAERWRQMAEQRAVAVARAEAERDQAQEVAAARLEAVERHITLLEALLLDARRPWWRRLLLG